MYLEQKIHYVMAVVVNLNLMSVEKQGKTCVRQPPKLCKPVYWLRLGQLFSSLMTVSSSMNGLSQTPFYPRWRTSSREEVQSYNYRCSDLSQCVGLSSKSYNPRIMDCLIIITSVFSFEQSDYRFN